MQASGQIHQDSVLGHSIPKNVITRSLGPNADVTVDLEGPFKIKPGDKFLLCSDGLSGLVDDSEMGTLMHCLPEDLAAKVMIDLANLRGGSDNSTVIIVRAEEVPGANEPQRTAPRLKQQGDVRGTLLLGTAGLCFLGAVVLGLFRQWGPMIVAIILGLIAVAVCGYQWYAQRSARPPKSPRQISGGKAPYRSYDARASRDLYDRLGETVQALRDAANENNWLMDWSKIDRLQREGNEALRASDAAKAIRLQAQTIVETMHQLREQNNRAAGETAIDH
jgi:protein phosphatase